MKQIRKMIVTLTVFGLAATSFCSAADAPASNVKIAVVNFKTCVDQSKLGKQEQSSFEALKKQMEQSLEEREKSMSEISEKFNDPDYLDSLSPEAETELKRKFRGMSQELSQIQAQYYQTLQQTNFKIVQKLQDDVTKAAAKIAEQDHYDIILNEESVFFVDSKYDISAKVIQLMDQNFEKEAAEAKEGKTAQ